MSTEVPLRCSIQLSSSFYYEFSSTKFLSLFCFDFDRSSFMDLSWGFPFVDFVLQPVYIDCAWDEGFVSDLDFDSLQLIMIVAKACSHLRWYLHSRVEYFAVKLAFWHGAQLPPNSWVLPSEEVVTQLRPIWCDMKKLQCGPHAAFHRYLYLYKPLREMTPHELMCLRQKLQRSQF